MSRRGSDIYRLLWWPTRTRRERWIWRFGYVCGVVSALYNYRRIHRAETKLASLRDAAEAVVNQDCETPEGEEAFEEAVHRLWMVLHGRVAAR